MEWNVSHAKVKHETKKGAGNTKVCQGMIKARKILAGKVAQLWVFRENAPSNNTGRNSRN